MSYIRFKNVGAFLLLFLVIFDLNFLGGFGSAIFTLFVCLFLILINPRKYIDNAHRVIGFFNIFIFLYIFLLLYVCTRIIFTGVGEYSFLLTMGKATSILIATILYLIVYYDSDLKKNMMNVFFINAIICLIFGTFPDIKFLIEIFQYGGEQVELIGNNEYRNAFLAGSGYFGISSLYGLAFAILLKITVEKKGYNFLKLLIIALAGLLAGRVALVCYLIAIIYYVFIKFNVKVAFISFVSLFAFMIILNNFTAFEGVKYWFYEMFIDNDISKSESVDQFVETFFLPSNELTMLFGDGLYGNSNQYYGGSDSGYIRNIYFGGLFYLILLLLTFFSIVYNIKKILYIYILIIISLFLHVKGVFIVNNPGFLGVFLISCIILFKDRQNNLKG